MESELLNALVADGAVAIAFCALMMSLASVSRHPALNGAVLFAFGHLGFAVGSSLFILLLDAGIPASQRPWLSWAALAVSTSGCAAMVDGMARLLEREYRPRVTWAAWSLALLLLALALLPWRAIDSLKLASDLTNTLGMAGLAVVLLGRAPAPYRAPTLAAGACASALVLLYFGGSLQQWAGLGAVVVPAYADWVQIDLALWQTINLCVMMLASFRALAAFVRRSRTDPLTHCLNRSGFEDALRALSLRMPRSVPVVVLAMDIDHFKSINDRLGHAAGDAYLERFAEVVRSCVRQSDLVARVGGEEFVAVLVDAHLDAGERVAAKINGTVRTVNVLFEDEAIRTTVSIGVADGFGLSAVDTLLRRADRAMYRAKSSGRDRVMIGGPEDVTGSVPAIDARSLRPG